MVGSAVNVIFPGQLPQSHHGDALGGYQIRAAHDGQGQFGGAVVGLCHRRLDLSLRVCLTVRLAGLFQGRVPAPTVALISSSVVGFV